MNYKYRHIILRSIKIGVGTTLAIIIAGFFKLDYPTAAGTITLLTLLTTKKETVKLIINRFITFLITIILSVLVFNFIDHSYLAFLVLLVLIVFIVNILKCENTLSVNALILIHFLSNNDYSIGFIQNELCLLIIGVCIAFIFNMIYFYETYDKQLKQTISYIDNKFQIIIDKIIDYINDPSSHSKLWYELGQLEKEIVDYQKLALEYDENVFARYTSLYVDYYEMREFQCSILHMLHYEIRKIRVMPDYAIYVKDYLAYLKPYINIKNDPALQLDHLNKVLEDIKKIDNYDFNSLTILYHVLMDMDEFLIRKKHFYDQYRDVLDKF